MILLERYGKMYGRHILKYLTGGLSNGKTSFRFEFAIDVPERILSVLSRHGEQYQLRKPELQPEPGRVRETGSLVVRHDVGTEPAVLANSLNEFLLVLVQPFRVGIKGCEHGMHMD